MRQALRRYGAALSVTPAPVHCADRGTLVRAGVAAVMGVTLWQPRDYVEDGEEMTVRYCNDCARYFYGKVARTVCRECNPFT
jgi:homospermidine synthase